MSEFLLPNQVQVVEDAPEVMNKTRWWLSQLVESDVPIDEISDSSFQRITDVYGDEMPPLKDVLIEIQTALKDASMQNNAQIMQLFISGYPLSTIILTLEVSYKKIAQQVATFTNVINDNRLRQQTGALLNESEKLCEPPAEISRVEVVMCPETVTTATDEVARRVGSVAIKKEAKTTELKKSPKLKGHTNVGVFKPLQGSTQKSEAKDTPANPSFIEIESAKDTKGKPVKKVSRRNTIHYSDNDETKSTFVWDESVIQPDLERLDRVDVSDMDPAEADAYRKNIADEKDSPALNPIKQYLKEIGKTELLSSEQEVQLAKGIEVGLFAQNRLDSATNNGDILDTDLCKDLRILIRMGKRYYTELVTANLRLVVSIAKRYCGRGLAFQDLIQHGNLGLIRAVQKFDYTKGYKFSTYATWWIRQGITRGLGDDSRTMRVPIHMHEKMIKVSIAKYELTNSLSREPTIEEISERVDLNPDKVSELQKYSQIPISLHTTVGKDNNAELGEHIADKSTISANEIIEENEKMKALEKVLQTLNPQERDILRLRFGLSGGREFTTKEIADMYGLTTQSLRFMQAKALAKLRHPSRSQILRQYAS